MAGGGGSDEKHLAETAQHKGEGTGVRETGKVVQRSPVNGVMGEGTSNRAIRRPHLRGPFTLWEVREDKDFALDIVSDNTDHKHVRSDLGGCWERIIVVMEKVPEF